MYKIEVAYLTLEEIKDFTNSRLRLFATIEF